MSHSDTRTVPEAIGPFDLRPPEAIKEALEGVTHIYAGGARCATDTRGHATPGNLTPEELVLDASEGFVPLWQRDVTLNWRFHAPSLALFQDPDAVASYVRGLMAEALLAWGDAVPVRFTEVEAPWDFEVAIRVADDCNPAGCVLARAFFPNAGQNDLVVYPRLFQQSRAEQIETMAHEFGHIFGLRHFFAQVSETAWPSEIYGTHDRFSIMNYGADSRLTETDIADLKRLYDEVWCGGRVEVGTTPIRLMHPYSHFRYDKPLVAAHRALAAYEA